MRLFRRKRFESEMDTELRFHIDAYVEDLLRKGLSREEAERRARAEFGALEAAKDHCRQAWGWQMLDELRADLRYTYRAIRQNPGFAAIAILSLALGIGANTAIFGLVDAVMLRILPVRDPGRLVFVENVGTQGSNGGPPYPCFELLRDNAKSFESMAAVSESNMELVIDQPREQLQGVWMSGNFFELLGVKPSMGRALTAADDNIASKDGPVAVISEAYWNKRFGGDRKVLGRTVRMDARLLTIVGVMPSDVMSLERGMPIDIAVPIAFSDPVMLKEKGSWWLNIVARLKPDASVERARSEADALFQAYMAEIKVPFSPEMRKLAFDHIELAPAAKGADGLRNRFSKPLMALMILVGLVLLTACANVANLLLARATARQREFAVRLAIGAGRGRLIRQTLTEALVLVGAGALLGVALARQGELAMASFFADGNKKIILDLSMNGRVLLFTLAISILTGLAFGLFPALRAARVDPAAGLGLSSRSTTGTRGSVQLGRALVVLQVALSTVLLAGAGLFIRSLRELESVDLGFVREGILTMEVTPEKDLIAKPEWFALQTEMLDRVRKVPGVAAASWSTMSPLSGRDRGVRIEIPGYVSGGQRDLTIHLVSISPEYFDTFATPLRLGRSFTVRDDASAPKVAILNETAARFYFGSASPIGKKMKFLKRPLNLEYEIVGVAKDAKHDSLREQPWRFVYLPVLQSIDRINRLALAVRTSGDASALTSAVTAQVRGARPTILITNITTMEKQVERSLIRERLVSTLSTAFGALALVLACIGLYGILAYAVTRRTNEIGVRMALGASTGEITWSVVREALTLAGAGLAIGIPTVLGLGSIAKTLLFGIEPFDALALISAAMLLLICAAVAGLVPARRAGRLDPMSALRCE